MLKPTNYDTTQASTGFVPIELGGHILEIKEVLEMQSKTGKTMIRVSFDFAQNDCQPRYFSESFRNDIRPEEPHTSWSMIRMETVQNSLRLLLLP